MNVQIFSPERKTGEALILEKISRLVWKHNGSVKLMDDTTFRATWDDTGKVGVVNLTKAELKEFATSAGSDKEVRQEILMETDDLLFKLRLGFDICCMTSEERRVPQIEEDPSLIYQRLAGAEDPEENFMIVLELPDSMPEKADLLDKCGIRFLMSILGGNTNRKEDIDNSVLAYKSAVHLTPQGHSDMFGRLIKLGVSLSLRFERSGDLEDISNAILYQRKAVDLTPEGHAYTAIWAICP